MGRRSTLATRTVQRAVALVLALSLVPVAPASAATDASSASKGASVRYLVKYKRGVGRAQQVAAASSAGFAVVKDIKGIGWTVLQGQSGRVNVAALKRSAAIVAAEPDVRAGPALAPNDSMYSNLWGLNNTGQSGGTPGADIGAESAWNTRTSAASVVVAIVDTGVQLAHPDLAGNAWVNPGEVAANGIDDDDNGYIDDVNGFDFANNDASVYDGAGDEHGTHVAGIVGAVGNNNLGVTGVAWDVQIMAGKFISPGWVSDACEAIVYAVDNGADVINHSWTTIFYTSILEEALDYAEDAGVLNIVAAGNSGANIEVAPEWPAASDADNVIGVAATDDDDALAGFSNRGAVSVDLAAPGVGIMSTVPGSYDTWDGTSMATPYVTGAAALLMAEYPGEDMTQIRDRLESTVETLPALVGQVRTSGRLDLEAAMQPFPHAPAIVSPLGGQTLRAAADATLTLAPAATQAVGTEYEVEVGLPAEHAANGDFEAGSLTGFVSAGTSAFIVTGDPAIVASGEYAARSGAMAETGGISTLTLTVDLPAGGAELGFSYLLDSEDWYDYAYLTIDGVRRWEADADAPWTRVGRRLSAGSHTLRWTYDKDGSVSEGLDLLALDDITLVSHSWDPVAPSGDSTAVVFSVPATSTANGAVRVRGMLGDTASSWRTVTGIEFDASPPSAPSSLTANTQGDGDILVTWVDPPDDDFAATRIVRDIGVFPVSPDDGDIVYEGVAQPILDAGFEHGTDVRYAAFAFDEVGNVSEAATIAATAEDTSAPGPVTGLSVVRDGSDALLSWTNPLDEDLLGVRVMAREGAPPTGPTDPVARVVSNDLTESATDVGLFSGSIETTVHYAAYAYDETPNYSDAARTSILADTIAPEAPAPSVEATGNARVELSWAPPVEPDAATLWLWRAEAAGAFSQLATLAPDAVSFVDTSVVNGVEYRYRLTAADGQGNVSSPSTEALARPDVAADRLAGADRYATALETSQRSFASADTVVLATGADFADALGAASLAGAYGGPVLLTRPDMLPDGLLGELDRLEATRVFVVGGTRAVSADVEDALEDAGYWTRRIAGADRYATAAAVAAETLAARSGSTLPGTVLIARGDLFPDALAASPVSYAGAVPLLLVRSDGVPASTLSALAAGGYIRAVVLGGTSVVPDEVAVSLGVTWERVAGADRYDTAARIALWARGEGVVSFTTLGLATGTGFPDALAGGAAVGAAGGALLLSRPTELPACDSWLEVLEHRREVDRVEFFGGESALSPAVATQLHTLLAEE